MKNLEEALKNKDIKGSGISINPSYAMKQLMVKMQGDINLALPSGFCGEWFLRVGINAFNSNPKLQTCEPMTFI
ncbi:MAG: recombinase RecT, partial [Paraclostridium sp.]